MDSTLIATSIIFIFKTLYPDEAAWGVSDTWATYITALTGYLWTMVTIIRKWDCSVFGRPGFGDLNDENPLKGD